MALNSGNFLVPTPPESDEGREAARREELAEAYRREHAGYLAQGKTDRAAAVAAAAKSELGVVIGGKQKS